jgi:hypothetical protein
MLLLFTLVAMLSANTSARASHPIEISLAHGSPAEMQTRDELLALVAKYNLSDWLWTRKIVIDQSAIPHSHPVLTIHTRHLHNDLLLLSTLVHEEYHWYETAHPKKVSAAIADLKVSYPGLPVGGSDGASDEESSYLHVIVCYVEWQKMKQLVGAEQARSAMEFWATDHYRAIYKLVLEHEQQIGTIVSRHGLLPPMT